MLTTLRRKFLIALQLVLVLIFILFEEIVWEGIAKPVYRWVHELKLLQRIEARVRIMPATLVLVVFVALFAVVEGLGLYAGVLFVSGHMLTGVMLYGAKIPVAAFTFWLFKATKPQLMTIGWFAWSYEKTMLFIDKLKAWPVYIETTMRLKRIKHTFKDFLKRLKARFFDKEGSFMRGMKRLYRTIKRALKRS
jgi:hypothetical protein